jgi:myo-inositol-1(or 4)-monophosphatase
MRTLQTLTHASVDLRHARAVAVRAAEAAGAVLSAGATGQLGARTKSATGDLVTDLDLAAERLIVQQIRRAFPHHRIIAEESGLLDAGDDSWSWLVDPLDGTNNIAIGLSNFVVGIALCREGVPVLGVVHDPVRGQTWSAVRGEGTRGPRGSVVLPPYRPAKHGPVLAWAQGYGVRRDDHAAQALRLVLESRSRRVLQLWAPLLAWVMLARGDIDGFVGYRAESVDLPAGSLIAREAGIAVYGFDGEPFDDRIDQPHDRNFVAGRPQVIPDLLAMVDDAKNVIIAGVSR